MKLFFGHRELRRGYWYNQPGLHWTFTAHMKTKGVTVIYQSIIPYKKL